MLAARPPGSSASGRGPPAAVNRRCRGARGLRLGVVVTDRLDHSPVAGRALVGDDDAPDRVLLAAHPGEPQPYRHVFLSARLTFSTWQLRRWDPRRPLCRVSAPGA